MIKTIGILIGGDSSEREVSVNTGNAVEIACKELNYNTIHLMLDNDVNKLIPKLDKVDFVFIALHGGNGENGVIQGLLESLKISYNGSGVLASSLGMEKSLTKQMVRSYDLLTPDWHTFKNIDDCQDYSPDSFPVIVKPSAGGSTLGLSIVKSQSEIMDAAKLASKYDGDIMIEKFIEGREITVTIIGHDTFPIVEIIPKHKFYDYECKYSEGMSNYVCPAELSAKLTEKIQNIALSIFNILKCDGYARADFILDENNIPWFLEINTLPGMTSTSLVPKSADAAGISFTGLIQMIITESVR